jgi:hypothetical protein
LNHLNGLVAVGLKNLGGISGTDPMGLEEDHYLADLLLIGPGFFDHLNPFSANALDFSELFNLLFNDVESFSRIS